MNKLIVSAAAALLSFAAYSEASVNNVIARQQWPWNGKVNIDFVISDPDDGAHDVVLTLKNGADEIALAKGSVTGLTEELTRGRHRLVWDPSVGATAETPKLYSDFRASVDFVDSSKKYMIVDFGSDDGTGAQNESYTVSFTNAAPRGGWPTDDVYKSRKMVLRRIPAGSFVMGSPEGEAGRDWRYETQKLVTLTKDFYIGVYPVTGLHYVNVMGALPANDDGATLSAVSRVDYSTLRGKTANANWPNVDADSWFGKLNAKASVADVLRGYRFDLPSAAQLEYAARAGTTTTWYNGENYDASCEADAGNYEPNLAKIGVYHYNGGISDTTAPTKYYRAVGVLEPNAWGLYNMLGTIDVFVRDVVTWSTAAVQRIDSTPVTSVDGVIYHTAAPYVFTKGGGIKSYAKSCRASQWNQAGYVTDAKDGTTHQRGFRVVCTYFGN